jgi:hypothetical protein
MGPPATAPPTAVRRFHAPHFALWLVCALITSFAISWLAAIVSARFAPLMLFPASVGLLLGTTLVVELRLTQTAHCGSVLAGALLAAAVVVAGQHFCSYWAAHTASPSAAAVLAAQAFPEVADRLRPQDMTFAEFLLDSAARGTSLGNLSLGPAGVWLLWGVNAAITAVVATLIVLAAVRQPFCDHCGTWYRVARQGTVDAPTAAAIASIAGMSAVPDSAASYRLRSCRGGCGPTAIELSWNATGQRSPLMWIDRATLAALTARIDGTAAQPPVVATS